MIYRAISRSKLPVAYSKGFNPRPKIGFAPALPLFTEAEGEYLDIELTERMTGVQAYLNPYLSPLSQILDERLIPIGTPSIDRSIRTLRYRANYSVNTTCADPQNQVNMSERIAFLKSQPVLPVEVEVTQKSGTRKQTSKKVLDLVPYLEHLEVDGDGSVSFTLRRLETGRGVHLSAVREKPQNADPLNGVETGIYENASQGTRPQNEGIDAKGDSTLGVEPITESGLASVKPSWVLDLINPTLKWSLTRTSIEMEPLKEAIPASQA
jgi:radical SAM-linked protein